MKTSVCDKKTHCANDMNQSRVEIFNFSNFKVLKKTSEEITAER